MVVVVVVVVVVEPCVNVRGEAACVNHLLESLCLRGAFVLLLNSCFCCCSQNPSTSN